mgnify:CR=1 FL=1
MTRNKKNRSSSLSTPLSAPSLSAASLSGTPLPLSGPPLEATVNLAPAAAAKLGTEASEKAAAAAAAESALPGWQSLGKDHKPTHANGKQGRREKKVRW